MSSQLSIKILILIVGCVVCPELNAQPVRSSEARDRGIRLLEQGDIAGAVTLLSAATKDHSNDILAWHWLGSALERDHKPRDARKAYEKAAMIADEMQSSMLDHSGMMPQTFLRAAADSATRYLALSPKLSPDKIADWRARAEFLRVFAEGNSGGEKIYSEKEVTTKVRFLSRQEPEYTREARLNQISGTVTLRAVLGADGQVRAIRVIARLPDGLTEQAIAVTQRIKFVPAVRDGHPVSVWTRIEYYFRIF